MQTYSHEERHDVLPVTLCSHLSAPIMSHQAGLLGSTSLPLGGAFPCLISCFVLYKLLLHLLTSAQSISLTQLLLLLTLAVLDNCLPLARF